MRLRKYVVIYKILSISIFYFYSLLQKCMKNVTILRSVQEMQKNPLEKADFCGVVSWFYEKI